MTCGSRGHETSVGRVNRAGSGIGRLKMRRAYFRRQRTGGYDVSAFPPAPALAPMHSHRSAVQRWPQAAALCALLVAALQLNAQNAVALHAPEAAVPNDRYVGTWKGVLEMPGA